MPSGEVAYRAPNSRPTSSLSKKLEFTRKDIKEEISSFFSETSFTALTRIYKAQSIFRRLAWTVVVVAMMSWLGVQCFWLLDRYFRYPIEVKLDLKASPELDFPSVTICNVNPILVSNLESEPFTRLSSSAEPDTSDSLFTATLTQWVFNDYSCPHGMFKCKDNICHSLSLRCDGIVQCTAGEDEANCTGVASCPIGFFACASGGQCTYSSFFCDNYNDCQDGSDEPAGCTPILSSTWSSVATVKPTTQSLPSVTTANTDSDVISGTGTTSQPAQQTTAQGSGTDFTTQPAQLQSTTQDLGTDITTQPAQQSTTQDLGTDTTYLPAQQSTMQSSGTDSTTQASQPVGRRKREVIVDHRHRGRNSLHSKRKYTTHKKEVNHLSGIASYLQSELRMRSGPVDKASVVKMFQESYINHMKKKIHSSKTKSKPLGKKHKVVKRRYKRQTRPTSRSSEDKSDFAINWDQILGNSTFNKWDALWTNDNGALSYYAERDDEWEAAMTYAYITAQLNASFVEQSGHLKKNMIASCEFNGYQCSPLNFTFFHNHKYGNCYTFNSAFSGNPTQTTRFQGPENGLKMELFINQDEYVANLATEVGARIVIHKRGSMPFPEDKGVTVMPGHATSIGMKQMQFSRLPPPHGVCAERGSVTDYYSKYLGTSYSKLSCLKSCYQNNIMEVCGCAVPFYFVPPSAIVCNMLDNVTENCVTQLPNVSPERFRTCDENCPQPCEETDYDLSISSSLWPSESYEEFLELKLRQTNSLYDDKDLDDHFIKIQIYYQDLIFSHIEQQKAYESMNLISDLGGQLGLWLGLSAITIGELCSFLFSVGRSLPSTWFGSSKTAPNDPMPLSNIPPATLEDMYDDLCPDEAKYIPPDIIKTKTDFKDMSLSEV
ncbi:amiloride-sensitive sodium channel subunit gamma [Plakobranchus ocellatus]|uniref:Amiloride-sensitive sodium channel subunit gamma n=1 Tax=Plakobranchus ocellatus TaxID=259542 RepID=A0AAV4CQR3_9GAST|nr:amiloride-sensitive sodium channel subunit gamma [Plakobranchus ocellatus]